MERSFSRKVTATLLYEVKVLELSECARKLQRLELKAAKQALLRANQKREEKDSSLLWVRGTEPWNKYVDVNKV